MKRNIFSKFRNIFKKEPKITQGKSKPVIPIQKKIRRNKVADRRAKKAHVRALIINGKPKYYKHLS